MDRYEALHILGLDDDASEEDVRLAFRELAQIMHPDRFQKNATLQARASEQFKLISNARDALLKDNVYTRKQRDHSPSAARPASSPSGTASSAVRWNALEQARLYLVAQCDHEKDNRRNGLIMTLAAFIISLVLRKYPPFMALTSAFAVYGVVSAIAAHMRVQTIEERLEEIVEEQVGLHT